MIAETYQEFESIMSDILAGCGMLHYYTSFTNSRTYETVHENTVLNDWSKVYHNRLYFNPALTYMSNPQMSDLNIYTYKLDTDDMCILADRLKGRWSSTQLPYANIIGDDMISDLLAGVFFATMSDDYMIANAYLQTALSLLSMHREEAIEQPRGNSIADPKKYLRRSLRV